MSKRIPQPTTAPREKTFLVGVELYQQKTHLALEDSLSELTLLADTAGLDVVGEITQKLDRPHVKTYIGPGKVDELQLLVEETRSQVIIFDDELSPRHQRELQEILGRNVRVLDRTALILDIFAQHVRPVAAAGAPVERAASVCAVLAKPSWKWISAPSADVFRT